MASLDEFEREQAVLLELESAGRVVVSELAERFGVSTVTVRKTLESLERRNALRRVRGGAVSSGVTDEGAFEIRVRHAARAKQAIARAAALEVNHGDVIAMDSSTSCYYLALAIARSAKPGGHHQRNAHRDAVHGAVVRHGADARRGAAALGRLDGRPDR